MIVGADAYIRPRVDVGIDPYNAKTNCSTNWNLQHKRLSVAAQHVHEVFCHFFCCATDIAPGCHLIAAVFKGAV